MGVYNSASFQIAVVVLVPRRQTCPGVAGRLWWPGPGTAWWPPYAASTTLTPSSSAPPVSTLTARVWRLNLWRSVFTCCSPFLTSLQRQDRGVPPTAQHLRHAAGAAAQPQQKPRSEVHMTFAVCCGWMFSLPSDSLLFLRELSEEWRASRYEIKLNSNQCKRD